MFSSLRVKKEFMILAIIGIPVFGAFQNCGAGYSSKTVNASNIDNPPDDSSPLADIPPNTVGSQIVCREGEEAVPSFYVARNGVPTSPDQSTFFTISSKAMGAPKINVSFAIKNVSTDGIQIYLLLPNDLKALLKEDGLYIWAVSEPGLQILERSAIWNCAAIGGSGTYIGPVTR